LLLRRGQFAKAESLFRAAIGTQTRHNPNPRDGEAYYSLGVCLTYLHRLDEAYDAFYKATWNAAWQDAAFLQLSQIAARRGHFREALNFIDSSLARNAHNQKAAHLKALLLRKLGRVEEAQRLPKEALARDPLDFGARNELAALGDERERANLLELMRDNAHSYLAIAADYANAGAYPEAIRVLEMFTRLQAQTFTPESGPARTLMPPKSRAPGHVGEIGMPNARPMVFYFLGYYASLGGKPKLANSYFAKARAQLPDRCFPNSLDSILALEAALQANPKDSRASFYLGNLWYDKRQVTEATTCWERARRNEISLPTVHRNLALVYFNKQNQPAKALQAMKRAFAADPSDPRVLFELDLLQKRARVSPAKRLAFLRKHAPLVDQREDLLVEFVTLLNFFRLNQEAFEILMSRKFHPWEGGEGKVTGQYVLNLIGFAKELLRVAEPLYVVERSSLTEPGSKSVTVYADETLSDPDDRVQAARLAIKLLERARIYPENLGEGKLHGAQENQVLYWLGVAHAQAGDPAAAAKYWQEASTGMKMPTPAVYYNDQNPETIFYQGLALMKLGKSVAAKNRFETLARFGREHLDDTIEIGFFAVSLPEFMVFDDDLNRRNQINCRYLQALGLLGLGRSSEAQSQFDKVLRLDPAHLGARLHQPFPRGHNR